MINKFAQLALFLVALQHVTTASGQQPSDWASFRGNGARGVADGSPIRLTWNADPDHGATEGVLWEVPVAGLGHSSPVVFGNKIFLLTAIAEAGEAELQVAAGGKPTAADDNGTQSWVVLCYDKNTGAETLAQNSNPRNTQSITTCESHPCQHKRVRGTARTL